MAILQFTLEEAYSGNTHINKYKDGVKIDEDIVSDWALPGYLECLLNEGYEKAYDVEVYRKDWEEAKEFERLKHEAYLDALTRPLYKKGADN